MKGLKKFFAQLKTHWLAWLLNFGGLLGLVMIGYEAYKYFGEKEAKLQKFQEVASRAYIFDVRQNSAKADIQRRWDYIQAFRLFNEAPENELFDWVEDDSLEEWKTFAYVWHKHTEFLERLYSEIVDCHRSGDCLPKFEFQEEEQICMDTRVAYHGQKDILSAVIERDEVPITTSGPQRFSENDIKLTEPEYPNVKYIYHNICEDYWIQRCKSRYTDPEYLQQCLASF